MVVLHLLLAAILGFSLWKIVPTEEQECIVMLLLVRRQYTQEFNGAAVQ